MREYSGKSIKKLNSQAIRALRSSKHDQAIEITQAIIDRDDNHAGAHAIQFSSLFKSKQTERARRMGSKAAELNPTSVFILNNQACLQLEAKQPAAAAGLLKSLIDQFGERGQWLYNLALAQRMVGNFDYAIRAFRRTLDLQPEHDRAAFQLADSLKVIGHHEESLKAYDYVRLLRSKHSPSHSNFIHHAINNNAFTQLEVQQEMSLWGARFIPKDKRYKSDTLSTDTSSTLGFLIGVIPPLWLKLMVAPVINELGKYYDINVYWHDERHPLDLFDDKVNIIVSHGFSDADFARRIRSDKVDTMIDICGMRVGSRQRSLGLHLCKRQFGWLAHEGLYTTPLIVPIDDALEQQRFFIASDKPQPSKQSASSSKTLFGIGSKQGLAHDVMKSWAYILHQLTDWQLSLDASNANVIKLLKHRFLGLGITNDRLIFDPKLSPNEGSIVLDNFIINEPVSAYKAIEAGGVLIALKGDLFPAQHTAALLAQLDRNEWGCNSRGSYANRAIKLALDGIRNINLLSQEQRKASKIDDLGSFVNHFKEVIER